MKSSDEIRGVAIFGDPCSFLNFLVVPARQRDTLATRALLDSTSHNITTSIPRDPLPQINSNAQSSLPFVNNQNSNRLSGSNPASPDWGQNLFSPPTLPSLRRFRERETVPSTPPHHQRSDSTAYYTADWESPYVTPASRRQPASIDRYSYLSRDLEDNPPAYMSSSRQLGVEGYSRDSEEGFSPSSPSIRHLGRALSQSKGQADKRTYWLSDDSAEGEDRASIHLTDSNQSTDGSWLGIGLNRAEDDTPTTPTLSSFLRRKERARSGEIGSTEVPSNHKPSQSSGAVPQTAYWDVFRPSSESSPVTTEKRSSRHTKSKMDSVKPSNLATDKSLPTPPMFERTTSEAPFTKVSPVSSPSTARPPLTSALSSRNKRKLVWRGKTCVIALPSDDKYPSSLLSARDVEAMLRKWEEEGFDTAGFRLVTSGGEQVTGGQSRRVFPDPEDVRSERQERSYKVSMPDLGKWKEYVKSLQEEKLRALGVSFGDEAIPRKKSPVSASMSRTSSQYPNHTTSPPFPPSSVASNHILQNNTMFSPPFNPSTNPSSHVGSVASPGSQYAGLHGNSHFPKSSIAFAGNEQPFASPYQFPLPQPTPPVQGARSPQNYFAARQEGASPATQANLQSFGAVLSPVSPASYDGHPQNHSNLLARYRLQQQQLQTQAVQQQFQLQKHQLNPGYMLPSQEPDLSGQQIPQVVSNRSHLDIAHPTPQGHRHNVSETLQKEIDEAESHFEESIQRQLEEGDDHHHQPGARASDLAKSQWTDLSSFKTSTRLRSPTVDDAAGDALSGQGESILSNYGEKHEGSDVDTNPSLSGEGLHQEQSSSDQRLNTAPRLSYQQHGHKPTLNAAATPFQLHLGHKSKPSTLNVAAKEFKFNPQSRFAAGNFSFAGTSFHPSSSQFNPSASAFNPSSVKYGALGSSRTGLNVAAPAFMPVGQPSRGLPSGEFSFSSAFNVDAPPFNPSQSFTSDTVVSGQSSSEEPSKGGSRIFDKVDLTNASGPVRRSRAVPIVRPDADAAGEIEGTYEDEEGRLAPALSRSKKARRGGSDGDQEPVFAVPSNPLNETAQAQSPSRDAPITSPDRFPGKENLTPQFSPYGSGDRNLPNVSIPARVDHLANTKETSQSEDAWSPFEFRDRDDAANFNAARPTLSSSGRRSKSSKSVEYLTKDDPEYLSRESPKGNMTPRRHGHALSDRSVQSISPLSANARPFRIDPPVSQYQYISEISDSGELGNKSDDHRESNQVHSSRDSVSSVPESSQRIWERDGADSEIDSGALNQETPSMSLDAESERPHTEMSSMPVLHDNILERSFQEIDDVMKHLNDEDSDLGVEETQTPWTQSSPMRQGRTQLGGFTPAQQLHPTGNLRSDAPSPSPRRVQLLHQHPQQDTTDFDLQSRSETLPGRTFGLGIQAPINRLNNPDNTVVSDWDDALSSEDEVKLQQRSQFFDSHVNNIIGGILESRLGPLEKSVNVIQHSVAQLAKRSTSQQERRSLSADVKNSDADDEDDEEKVPVTRSTSPRRKDRRVEGVKAAVLEALATHQLLSSEKSHPLDLSRIHEVLAEMKLLAEPAALQNRASELKTVVEEVISTHPRLRGNRAAGEHTGSAEKLKLQIDGLESMLRIANDRAEEEYRTRRAAEDVLAEVRRSLKLAEEEAAQHRESAVEAEESLRAFHEDKQHTQAEALERTSSLEDQLDDLQTTTSQLSEKNAALESTLAEYRLSSDEWRQDLDDAKGENIRLLRTIEKIKHQLEENMDSSKKMSSKFERLQEEMIAARRDVAQEQSTWRRREEDLILKYETLQSRFDKEVKVNEKLELEVEQLEAQEKEGLRVKIAFDQSQQEIAKLEEIVTKLRHESLEHERNSARFEREFNNARESASMEVQRTRASLEADIDVANNQVNMVRDNLESEIARLQARVDNVKLDAETQNARHELRLEEAHDAKRMALGEAAQNREAAMQEQHRIHERAMNDLRERHGRALHNASEDKQRIEGHLSELLVLEKSKKEYLQDKITHLEEKLEIAKSAALAAVQAAQTAKLPMTASPSHPSSSRASMLHAHGSEIPEKISPQALRESIISLQEQLHEREGRVEILEQELSEIDRDAPTKIKDRDTEIAWLRELLGVRIDDLQDIINILSEPAYDRDAVRDAAIRLKTNLQMEQQEKERAIAGGQRFPQLDLISNLASPRALPRAATFAMERFNKVRDSSISSSLSDIASRGGETPSRITSGAQSFLSSWINTPTANPRSNPLNLGTPTTITTMGGRRISTESRPLGTYNAQRSASLRMMEAQPEREEPSTPSLTRKSSYDLDAENTILGASMYSDENRRPLEAYSSSGQRSSGGTFSP